MNDWYTEKLEHLSKFVANFVPKSIQFAKQHANNQVLLQHTRNCQNSGKPPSIIMD